MEILFFSTVSNSRYEARWFCVSYLLPTSYDEITFRHSEHIKTGDCNVAELTAVQHALQKLSLSHDTSEIHLFSDSRFTVNALLGLNSIRKNSYGEKFVDICRSLYLIRKSRRFYAHWIPSHCGIPNNEIVDQIARNAALQVTL